MVNLREMMMHHRLTYVCERHGCPELWNGPLRTCARAAGEPSAPERRRQSLVHHQWALDHLVVGALLARASVQDRELPFTAHAPAARSGLGSIAAAGICARTAARASAAGLPSTFLLTPPTCYRGRSAADLSHSTPLLTWLATRLHFARRDADPGVVPEPALEPARPQPHQGVQEALPQDGVVGDEAPRHREPLGEGRR